MSACKLTSIDQLSCLPASKLTLQVGACADVRSYATWASCFCLILFLFVFVWTCTHYYLCIFLNLIEVADAMLVRIRLRVSFQLVILRILSCDSSFISIIFWPNFFMRGWISPTWIAIVVFCLFVWWIYLVPPFAWLGLFFYLLGVIILIGFWSTTLD